MSGKCAGGFELPPGDAKCPKCGASSGNTCGEWVRKMIEAEKILTAFHGDDWLEKLRAAYDGTYT